MQSSILVLLFAAACPPKLLDIHSVLNLPCSKFALDPNQIYFCPAPLTQQKCGGIETFRNIVWLGQNPILPSRRPILHVSWEGEQMVNKAYALQQTPERTSSKGGGH